MNETDLHKKTVNDILVSRMRNISIKVQKTSYLQGERTFYREPEIFFKLNRLHTLHIDLGWWCQSPNQYFSNLVQKLILLTNLRELKIKSLDTADALSLVRNDGLRRLEIDFKAKVKHFEFFFECFRHRKSSLTYSNAQHEINQVQFVKLHDDFKGKFVFESLKYINDEINTSNPRKNVNCQETDIRDTE